MADKNKTVLVVEDAIDIQEILTELLSSEGYRVESAANGQEALDKLAKADELPGLILLDLMMPKMDGFQFLSERKKNTRISSIPVIIMTADVQAQYRPAATEAQAFLKKPFADIDLIFRTVASFFRA